MFHNTHLKFSYNQKNVYAFFCCLLVLGLKGFAPFYHRDIDYEMFDAESTSGNTAWKDTYLAENTQTLNIFWISDEFCN